MAAPVADVARTHRVGWRALAASGGLFGATAPAPAGGSLFGAPAPASGGLFGSTPAPAPGGLFAPALGVGVWRWHTLLAVWGAKAALNGRPGTVVGYEPKKERLMVALSPLWRELLSRPRNAPPLLLKLANLTDLGDAAPVGRGAPGQVRANQRRRIGVGPSLQ